ncbi:MAG: sigma-70 family RNA polymerase sigma factor [Vallitalea sp.]|jgi:RNA polymerase sigma-70 factor (ECF subfamily)|nr:sigma-70 family RNA polymerase sigma factor [Vallitalea sp.]
MFDIDNDNEDLYKYLFDKYYRLVYSTAYRIIKNKEDCEEIVQDAFRIGFKNIKKMKDINHFRNYVLKSTYNLAITRVKKNNAHNNIFITPINDDISTDKDMIKEVFEDIYVSQLVEGLPIIDKEVILLYSQGYKIREIAQLLSISVPNAKVKLYRTRKLLIQNLEGELVYERQRESV